MMIAFISKCHGYVIVSYYQIFPRKIRPKTDWTCWPHAMESGIFVVQM